MLTTKTIDATHERIKVIPQGADDRLYRKPHSPQSYIFDEYALGWRRGYYKGGTLFLQMSKH